MALSNWDVVAWDEKGKPCEGVLHTPDGVIVEIYKNWVSVMDASAYDAWNDEHKAFIRPYIMNIDEGVLSYKNIRIFVKRGKQNGVYVVAIYHNVETDVIKAIYGVGCYGFDENDEYVGVKKETIEDFIKWLKKLKEEYGIPYIPENFEPPQRFNLGDKFFAECLGFETPMTEPEKAEEPLLLQALKKLE